MLDYDEFEDLVHDLPIPVSEAHGVLVGFLASAEDFASAEPESLSYLLSECSAERALDLLTEVHAQLESVDLDFAPLVPDDEEPMQVRLSAMADFCTGFLFGYGCGIDGQVSTQAVAILRDLQQIAELDDELDDDDDDALDEAEYDFVEVFEFVKVATLALYGALPMPAEDDEDEDEAG